MKSFIFLPNSRLSVHSLLPPSYWFSRDFILLANWNISTWSGPSDTILYNDGFIDLHWKTNPRTWNVIFLLRLKVFAQVGTSPPGRWIGTKQALTFPKKSVCTVLKLQRFFLCAVRCFQGLLAFRVIMVIISDLYCIPIWMKYLWRITLCRAPPARLMSLYSFLCLLFNHFTFYYCTFIFQKSTLYHNVSGCSCGWSISH